MDIFIASISFRENSQTIESSGFIFNSSRILNSLNKQFRPYTRENILEKVFWKNTTLL